MSRSSIAPPKPLGGARRVRAIAGVAVAGLMLAAGCGTQASEQAAGDESGSDYAGVVLGEPTERPDFELTDVDGAPYDFYAETEGKLTFLFFGYTNCPDVCPVHMAQLSEILDRPGMPPATVVFVTADPTRDTPKALKKFLGNFDPDFVGLTGADDEIAAAEKAAGVPPAQLDTDDGEPDPDGGYTVSHAGQVLAFAPDNKGYTVYPFGTRTSQYADDIPLLAAIKAETNAAPVAPTSSTTPAAPWGGASLGDITIADARAPEPTGPNGALYFSVTNDGTADTLVAVSTESAPEVQFHNTVTDGETTSMSPVPDGIEVAASGDVTLEPGGTHAMLIDVKDIEAGDMMPITLTFENAGDLNVLVPVVPVTEATK